MPVPLGVVVAAKLAPIAFSAISKLFGGQPRGDLQKFKRNAYPYMYACAKQTGLNVYIGWFGKDEVVVKPDGSYGVAVPGGDTKTWEQQDQAIAKLQGSVAYYLTRCPRSDGDCVNHPQDYTFELITPAGSGSMADGGGLLDVIFGSSTTNASGTAPASSGMSTWLIVGLAALVLIILVLAYTRGKK